jgi:6-phosphogluconolactonase
MPQSASARVALYASVGPELTQYDVDVEAAALVRRGTVTLLANVHYAWPHVSGRHLYVASSDSAPGIGAAGDKHHVTAFRIDPATGALTPHGQPIRLPTRPIHMTTDIPSDHLLVAFSNPSAVRVYRVNPDATPGDELRQPEPIDAGIYGHQVRVSRDNRLVILVTRGHDAAAGKTEEPGALKVFQCQRRVADRRGLGGAKRRLRLRAPPSRLPPEQALGLRFARAPEQARHVRYYRWQAFGGAGLSQGPLAEPGNIRGRQAAGTVHVHPNGRFVYAANRASSTVQVGGKSVFAGGENTFAVYEIDATTGEPVPIQHVDTRGIHCRTFHIDPSGRMLVAAHIMPLPVREGAAIRIVPASLAVFRIDDSGKLDFVRKYDVGVGNRTMFWMGMVPL